MFKKICSLLLLICILVSSFTGMNSVFAYDNPSDFGQLVFQIDKSEVALGESVTFIGSHPAHRDRDVYVAFQIFDENGDPMYPDECWVEIIGHTSGTDGSFSIPFSIPGNFTPRTYGFEVAFTDPVLGGICYRTDVKLTVSAVAAVNKSSLQSAISAANANKASVVVSVYGSEVETVDKWVTQQEMTAYETAIATAQGVFSKTNASQAEVDQAVTNLATATVEFNNAKKSGAMVAASNMVSIRVEGISSTMVKTSENYTTQKSTVYEAVYELLKNNSIPIIASDTQYGKYVSSINNVTAGTFGGYDGWMYAVNNIEASVSMDACSINNGDDIVVYYGGFSPQTYLPQIEISATNIGKGSNLTVSIQAVYFDWNTNSNVTVKICGASIKLSGQTYTTDANGQAIITVPDAAGDYTLEISQNREGNYPLLVRTTQKITVIDSESIGYTVSRQAIVLALEKATNKLIEKFDDSSFNYQQHWMAIAIKGFDKSVPGSYLQAIENGDMPAANSGQYGKYILGILAAGGDPTNINGRNLLAELCQLSDMRAANTEGGIYTTPFGLLALDAVNYEIPADAGFTRDDLINKLISLASPAGGEDGVGFVLTALGKYYNEKPAVKAAVDSVISAWASRQCEDGGFGAGAWSAENNVNTAAQVLMGLSFNGKDPQSEQFTKAKGNIVSFILSLQNADGTFNWQKSNAGSISMATEQAAYALAQYLRQLDGRKSIYDFTSTTTDETAPVISTNLEDKTVNASSFMFAASADDAVDGTVEPVVKLNGITVAGTVGAYKVVLSQGSNAITITATDLSGNKAEKSCTIIYTPKTQEIPAGDQPKVDIPADNDDYKIEISSNEGDKEITIVIPEDKTSVVIVDLPSNSSLPQIVTVKGDVTALIPKGTQVTGGNASDVELITSVNGSDNVLKDKVKDIIPDDKELGSIVKAFSMGNGQSVEFSDFIVLTFKGMQGKEAAYIQNGIVYGIQKYSSDSEGLSSGRNEYAYGSGNDLIVKTKHFTDFIAYTVNTVATPGGGGGGGGGTQPQPAKFVTLSVDKLTINEGYVVSSTQVELQTGDTAWTLLKRELDKRGISYKYIWTESYESVYVQSIDGDGEFDHGSGSGWMYAVNGWYPNYGATKYILKDGDKLKWRYTTNLGADLGEDLSKWDNPGGTPATGGGMPVINSGDKTPTIEIPKDIEKDYILNITKEYTDTDNITINIPEVKAKVILNLEAVKSELPALTAVRGNASLVIDKGTQIKAGNSYIEVLTPIDVNAAKILELIKSSINSNEKYGKVNNAFFLGNANNTVLFDKLVTVIFKGAKGQYAGFIEGNKFTPIEIYETDEKGALATKDSEKIAYAFIKDNDLYIKTNHFTTFVSYTIENNNFDFKKMYKDEGTISSWAYEAIGSATQKGFIGGNNGKFNPKDNIARAEFTKIMVSVLGLDIKADKVINFTDVKEDNWFYPYVNAAYAAGIIKGSGSNFNPDDKITREQMAAIIIRVLGVKPIKPVTAIKDMNAVSDCFKTDVETIFALGLMVGDGIQFNPVDFATREMAVVVAMKAYHYRNGEYTKNSEVKKYIEETGALMLKTVSNPVVSSVGGEWTVLSLARSGIVVPNSYYEIYYENVEKKLKEKSGKLHNVKYTEYDRVVLALSAIGKDVTNVDGYDLIKPLADFNTVIKQGLNGPVWALIALDSNNYQIPADKNVVVQTTREMLVNYILSKEISGGGWSLTSEAPADTDITAMALQALSKYQDNKDVKAAIDRALNILSAIQQSDGSFKSSWGDETSSESVAQVVVALTCLNIDPATDKRFIKNGKNPVSALLSFYVTGGGFKHTLNGELDAMATDQGMYALVAYDRYVNEQKQLYDMTDVK